MTVYVNYDVFAFKSCIQILTVYHDAHSRAKSQKNLEECVRKIQPTFNKSTLQVIYNNHLYMGLFHFKNVAATSTLSPCRCSLWGKKPAAYNTCQNGNFTLQLG